jgi:hypothetical protein
LRFIALFATIRHKNVTRIKSLCFA